MSVLGSITVEQTDVQCWCGIAFSVPTSLYDAVRRLCDIRPSSKEIYCPLGHTFSYGASTKVKELQDQLAASRAQRDQLLARAADLIAERDRLERKVKRAHRGTCTECNRSFANLSRHMQTKHKDVKP